MEVATMVILSNRHRRTKKSHTGQGLYDRITPSRKIPFISALKRLQQPLAEPSVCSQKRSAFSLEAVDRFLQNTVATDVHVFIRTCTQAPARTCTSGPSLKMALAKRSRMTMSSDPIGTAMLMTSSHDVNHICNDHLNDLIPSESACGTRQRI